MLYVTGPQIQVRSAQLWAAGSGGELEDLLLLHLCPFSPTLQFCLCGTLKVAGSPNAAPPLLTFTFSIYYTSKSISKQPFANNTLQTILQMPQLIKSNL